MGGGGRHPSWPHFHLHCLHLGLTLIPPRVLSLTLSFNRMSFYLPLSLFPLFGSPGCLIIKSSPQTTPLQPRFFLSCLISCASTAPHPLTTLLLAGPLPEATMMMMHPGDSSNRATTTTTHFLPPSALKSKPCRCRSKRRRRNQRKSSAPRARPPAPTNPQAVGHGDSSFVCDVCLMILKKQPPPIHQTQISLLGPWAMMMLVGLGRLGWLTTQDELLLRRAARIRPTEMVAEQQKKTWRHFCTFELQLYRPLSGAAKPSLGWAQFLIFTSSEEGG